MGHRSKNTVSSVMEKTYDELVLLKLCSNEGETVVMHDDLNLPRASRDYSSLMKILPGSKYKIMTYMYIKDGFPFELVANLVSVEMINDGLERGITKTAVYTLMNPLNSIRNTIVKSKGQWTDNHEAWILLAAISLYIC